MSTANDRLTQLFTAWYTGNTTAAEETELAQLCATMKGNEQLAALLKQFSPDATLELPGGQTENMISAILKKYPAEKTTPSAKTVSLWKRSWIRYAAAILILSGAGAYLWNTQKETPPSQLVQRQPIRQDIAAGTNKATLTLSDGRTITLDSAADGQLTMQGAAAVIKRSGGQVVYSASASAGNEPLTFNTMSTPRGGQYQLRLPDGTMVWLNAASSITYPVAFTGKRREVTVTGEVYLEVKKIPEQPFTVMAGGVKVEVLGTSLNIDAYGDQEKVTATLLSGAVRVVNGIAMEQLTPGQQARVSRQGDLDVELGVDTAAVVAWKNGRFEFSSTDIRTLMREVMRWYDIDVAYEGKISADRFTGSIPRSASLNELLAILEESRVHFRLEGRKLTVLP